MTRTHLRAFELICLLVLAGLVLAVPPVQAVISAGTIAVSVDGNFIRSTSVTTIAIVTQDPQNSRKSFIECYFQTATGQVGLHLHSRDQRRIEAFYQQILSAAAGGGQFQITAYSSSTYQPDGYVANLESDIVYLILY